MQCTALMEDKKARMLRDCHKGASSLHHSCYCSICNRSFTSEKYLRSHNTQNNGQHARATHPSNDFSCPHVPLLRTITIHQHHKHKEQTNEPSTDPYAHSVLCPASSGLPVQRELKSIFVKHISGPNQM